MDDSLRCVKLRRYYTNVPPNSANPASATLYPCITADFYASRLFTQEENSKTDTSQCVITTASTACKNYEKINQNN